MKLLVFGKLDHSHMEELAGFGHEVVSLSFKNDSFYDEFDNITDTQYYVEMKRRLEEIYLKSALSDGLLIMPKPDSSAHVAIVKATLLEKDLYFFDKIMDTKCHYKKPIMLNKSFAGISKYNMVQNRILDLLKVDSKDITEMSKILNLNHDICTYEVTRLIEQGVINQNNNSYSLINERYVKRMHARYTMKKKY